MTSAEGIPAAGWYADPYGITALRWWDGGRWTQHVLVPGGGSNDEREQGVALAWISAGVLGLWCLLGVSVGILYFLDTTVQARALASERSWHNPIPADASFLVASLWFLSMNLLVPGLVVGVLAIVRQRRRRIVWALALVLGVAGGSVAEFALLSAHSDNADPTNFVAGGRLDSLLFIAVAVLVAIGVVWTLGLFSRRTR